MRMRNREIARRRHRRDQALKLRKREAIEAAKNTVKKK
jgi:hypothetical protein